MFLNNFISLESNRVVSNRRYLYGTVDSFDFLSNAKGAQKHEYWYIETDSGQVGICKIIDLQDTSKNVQYGLVLKPNIEDGVIRLEKEISIGNEEFAAFKSLATKGMLRDSYFFDLDNSELRWKVDCFASENKGELYSNVIRLSIKDWPSEQELPKTPMELRDPVEENGNSLEGEQKELVEKLYNEIFLVINGKNEEISESNQSEEENDYEESSDINETEHEAGSSEPVDDDVSDTK